MNDLQVAYIQADLHWENPDANRAMLEEQIWTFVTNADLIVLPEMFTTGFSMNPEKLAEPMNGHTTRWMKQMAGQTGTVITGSLIIKINQQYYNRLLVVYPNGEVLHYDKRHLFTLAGEHEIYQPGNERLVFEVNGWKICALICYDLRFPVWARSQKSEESAYEYDLLLYVANWPKQRIKSWDALLAARAIENNAYCMGVNRVGEDGYGAIYNGHSAIYNYLGEQLSFSEEEVVQSVSLSARALGLFRSRFPFQKDADNFEIL